MNGLSVETLTVEEAAQVLGIHKLLAYRAVRKGEIPSIKIGRRILIPRAKLMSLLGVEPGLVVGGKP